MPYNNFYGNGYQPGFYAPVGIGQDNLSQLRQGAYQNQMMNNPMNTNPQGMMANSMQPQQAMNTQANVSAPNSGIIWVSGEREAAEYPIAPNNAVALWDSNNPVIYLKQADASGKPSTEIYDLIKRNPIAAQQAQTTVQAMQNLNNEYVTRDEFNALAAKFDALAVKESSKTKRQSKDTVDNE